MGVPEKHHPIKIYTSVTADTIYFVFVSNGKTIGVPLPNTTKTNEPPAHTTHTMVKTRVQLEVT